MPLTLTLDNAIAEWVMRGTTTSLPTARHVALSLADPEKTGSGLTEPTGGSYGRVLVSDWTSATWGFIENGAGIVFATPTADWGRITHVALMTAATGGTLLAYGSLETARVIRIGANVRFLPGAVRLSITG